MEKIVLVIESEDSVRDNITEFLESKNFTVRPAETGEAALNTIAYQESPHLIICNLILSDGDGYTVLKLLRDKKETQSVPLILITDETSRKSYRLGMELGADDYLVKPFTNEELMGAINSRLSRKDDIKRKYELEIKQLKKQLKSKQEKEKIQEEVWSNLFSDLRSKSSNIKLAIHLLQQASYFNKKRIYLKLLEEECAAIIDLINRASDLRFLLTPEHLELIQRYHKES